MGASCDACQAAVRRQRHPDHLHPHVQNAGRRSQGAGTARGPMPAMHSQGGRPQIGIDAWNAPRCLTRRPGLVDTVRNAASGMAPFCCPVLRSASNKQHWAATEVARQRRGPDATEIRRLRGRSRASTPRVGHLGTHLTRPPSGHSPPRLGWHPRTFPPHHPLLTCTSRHPPPSRRLPSSPPSPPASRQLLSSTTPSTLPPAARRSATLASAATSRSVAATSRDLPAPDPAARRHPSTASSSCTPPCA